MLDRLFQFQENNTTLPKELLAGLTTFAAMAYILAVNPLILADAGMDRSTLVTVTGLAAAIGCFLMAASTNYPIALAPGMGTNAYFTFFIVLGMQVPWQGALALVFWNGVLFLILSVTGIRSKLVEALPHSIQIGIQCGIGFFIAFLGLQASGIVVDNPATLLGPGDFLAPAALLTILGLIAISVLTLKKVPGAIIGVILLITLVGLIIPNGDTHITAPPSGFASIPASIGSTFLQLDWLYPFRNFTETLPILLTLLLLDLFDSIGTIIGVSRRAKLVDSDGKLPKMGKALTADSLATIVGAMLGTSTNTSYVESAAGVEAGGRTGLTAVVVGICFLLALFFNPIISVIPAAATAPALIMVGIFMSQGFRELDFDDFSEVAPAILTALLIPLTFSIMKGIALGLIVYTFIVAVKGEAKKVPMLTYILTAVFIGFFVMDKMK